MAQPLDADAIETRLANLIPRLQRADRVVAHEPRRPEHVERVRVARIPRERLQRERLRFAPAPFGEPNAGELAERRRRFRTLLADGGKAGVSGRESAGCDVGNRAIEKRVACIALWD